MYLLRLGFLFLFFFTAAHPAARAHHSNVLSSSERASSLGGSEISSGSMINQPTASTLGKHRVSAGFTFNALRYNAIPAGDAHALHHRGHHVHGKNHEELYTLDAGYGLTKDWDLYLSAPIVSKNSIDIESHRSLGSKDSATGFGDMRIISKYRFSKKYVEAALIAGLKFPTGKTDAKRPNSAKFEAENQPGSGSWDGDFGIALSRSFKRHLSTASSFQYTLHSEGAQEHRTGDLFRLNLGVSYALRELGKYPNLSFVTELNQEWGLKDKSRGAKRVADSGGTSLFVTPGFNADLTDHLAVFWGIAIPIYQNLGGEHEELNYNMLTGINLGF